MNMPALNTQGIDITQGLDRMERNRQNREVQKTRDKQNALLDMKLSPEAIKADKAMQNALLQQTQLKNMTDSAKVIRDVIGSGYVAINDASGKAIMDYQKKLTEHPVFGMQAKMMLPKLNNFIQVDASSPTGYTITKENREKLRKIYEGIMTETGKVANRGKAEYTEYIDGNGEKAFIPTSLLQEVNPNGIYKSIDLQKVTKDPGAKFKNEKNKDIEKEVKKTYTNPNGDVLYQLKTGPIQIVDEKTGEYRNATRNELKGRKLVGTEKANTNAKYSKLMQNEYGELRIMMNDGSVKKIKGSKAVDVTEDDNEDANKYIPFEGQPSAVEQMLMKSMGGEFAKPKFKERPLQQDRITKSKTKPKYKEGQTATNSEGKRIIYKNGKWEDM